MKYKIDWYEKKGEDWVILALSDGENSYKDVSVNRKNKKGEIFPNFDQIANGGEVEGKLWTSGAGKLYLFAPEAPKMASGSSYRGKAMEVAMDKKNDSIARFQGDKEMSIKVASTFSQSVALAIAEFQANRQLSATGPSLEQLQKKWREYLWLEYDKSNTDFPPIA